MNSELTIEKYETILEIFEGLGKAAGITDKDTEIFVPEADGSEKGIVNRLCISLQNSGQMRNSIKFKDNEKKIKKAVCDYNSTEFVKTYKDWTALYNDLISMGIEDNGVKKGLENGTPKSNWEKYSKGLYDGIIFLESKNGYKTVKDLIKKSGKIDAVTNKMIKSIGDISKEIHNMGFALTCDWLKECGCTWLVKPDVHIVEVYKHLTGEKNPSNSEIIQEMFDYSAQIRAQKDKTMTAYKLDKMIWLICTGNFYQKDIKIGRDLIMKRVNKV